MTEWDMVLAHALTLMGATADHPFEEDFTTTVLRHGEGGKWFGLLMKVRGHHVGRDADSLVDVLNLKIEPEESYAVREMCQGILPAYHMNKRHWISVLLDGSVPFELVAILMEKSYELTRKKLPKRKQTEENGMKKKN